MPTVTVVIAMSTVRYTERTEIWRRENQGDYESRRSLVGELLMLEFLDDFHERCSLSQGENQITTVENYAIQHYPASRIGG